MCTASALSPDIRAFLTFFLWAVVPFKDYLKCAFKSHPLITRKKRIHVYVLLKVWKSRKIARLIVALWHCAIHLAALNMCQCHYVSNITIQDGIFLPQNTVSNNRNTTSQYRGIQFIAVIKLQPLYETDHKLFTLLSLSLLLRGENNGIPRIEFLASLLTTRNQLHDLIVFWEMGFDRCTNGGKVGMGTDQ